MTRSAPMYWRLGMSAVASTALIAIPSAALAYVSPEDVFGTTGTPSSTTSATDNLQAPPTLREASSRVAAQQAASMVNRAIAQSDLRPVDAVASSAASSVASGPKEPVPSRLDPNVNYEIRQERIAEQAAKQPTVIIASNGSVLDARGNVLHSGAPIITRTGPETAFAAGALILAALGTLATSALRRRVDA